MTKLELAILVILIGTILALTAKTSVWDGMWPVGVTEPTIIERSQP